MEHYEQLSPMRASTVSNPSSTAPWLGGVSIQIRQPRTGPLQARRRCRGLWPAILVATAWLVPSLFGQISVPPGGVTLTFDSRPPASEWATHVRPGVGTTYQSVDALDAGIQQVDQAIVTTQLPTTATVPPSTSSLGYRYNTAALYIQSRPTTSGTNAANVLKATLRNDIGSDATSLTISYDFGRTDPQAAGTDELPGWYVYYSLSGLPNTWVKIPELSGVDTAGRLEATIDLSSTPWPAGSLLYILWADDNDEGQTDTGYTMDNVTFTAVGGTVTPFLRIQTPTNGASFNQTVPISVTTAGAGLVGVGFTVDNVFYSSDLTAPYTAVLTGLSVGTHQLRAFGTNNQGQVVPAENNPITFTVTPNTGPSITITSPPPNWTVLVGTAITNLVTATDDVAVVAVEWYVDNELYYTRSNANWAFVWSDSLPGPHTIRAVAYDIAGLSASSEVTVIVTNPPADGFTILVPNGSEWRYYAQGQAPPADAGGNQWNTSPFYDFAGVPGWSNGIASLGGGNNWPTPGAGGQPADAYYPARTQIDIGPANPRYSAVYFQKEFVIEDDPSSYVGLVFRLLVDDGAVVYLNGWPVMTNNMTITNWPVPYGQLANAAEGSDGLVYREHLMPASDPAWPMLGLQPGPNIVAVEVHQSSLTSSDLNFDLMIWASTYSPPTVQIISPTNGQSLGGGCAGGANVAVQVSGSLYVTNVVVFVDGSPAGESGARNAQGIFTVNVTVPLGTHTLTAQGTDSFGAVSALSPPVSVTVLPNQPPVVAITAVYSGGVTSLVWGVGTALTNAISVSDPDGTITNLEFRINGAFHLSRTNNFTPVIVNDALAGTSVFQAVAWDNCGLIATSAPVTVTITNPPDVTLLVTNGSLWKYFNLGREPDADGLGRPWWDPNYDDSAWRAGLAELGGGDGDVAAPNTIPERTVIDTGPSTNRHRAIYFRREFTVAAPGFAQLIVNVLRDDGVLVYLNGQPIFTNNMPNVWPITYDTLAPAAAGDDGTVYVRGTAAAGVLLSGRNVLAVEVHQNSATSSDLSFDLMLWGQGAARPRLEIALVDHDGDPFTPLVVEVRWNAPGATLIESTDVTKPLSQWTPVPGATSPYRPPMLTPQKFYALRIP